MTAIDAEKFLAWSRKRADTERMYLEEEVWPEAIDHRNRTECMRYTRDSLRHAKQALWGYLTHPNKQAYSQRERVHDWQKNVRYWMNIYEAEQQHPSIVAYQQSCREAGL